MARRARVRPVRRVEPGASADRSPGARLSCAVLSASPEEWVGVDLATGAFVRTRHGAFARRGAGEMLGPAADTGLDEGAAGRAPWAPLDVAVVSVGEDLDPPDPARPEAVALAADIEPAGRVGRRAARRLLRHLAAPEQPGAAVLGTRGPSIAYVDLDARSPSVVLLASAPRHIECYLRPDGAPACSFTWSGTTQALPLLDSRLRSAVRDRSPRPLDDAHVAAAIGGRPAFLLVGLTAVRDGHVPKAVLAVLAR